MDLLNAFMQMEAKSPEMPRAGSTRHFRSLLVTLILALLVIAPMGCQKDFQDDGVVPADLEEQIFLLGRYNYFRAQYATALATFQDQLTQFPNGNWADDAHYYMGRTYHQQGLILQARTEYATTLAALPVSNLADYAQYYMGRTYQDEVPPNYPQAIIEFQLVQSNYPTSPVVDGALYEIGYSHFAQAQALVTQALALLAPTALDLAPAFATFDQALAAYQLTLAKYPLGNYADNAQYYIGRVHYDKAQALLALPVPDAAGAAAEYALAFAGFQAVIANYPFGNYADNAQYYLGRIHFDQGNFATAVVELQKVIAGYPSSTFVDNAWYYLGRSHHALGGATELAAARNAYQTVYTYFPLSSYADNAMYHFAKTYHDEGNCRLEYPAMQALLVAYPLSFYAGYATTHSADILLGALGTHVCLIPYP